MAGENKSLEERYADEVLTDNAALNHYAQCKDCMFRDKTTVQGKECGWNGYFCRIYGKASVSRIPQLKISYTPLNNEDKPNGVYNNTEPCEFYEKEK